MEKINFKVVGIGPFAANCIREIDSHNIPEVKTKVCRHLSEYDVHHVNEFLNEEHGVSIVIADLGYVLSESLVIATINMANYTGGLTLCILTIPFIFEGKKAFKRALRTASTIKSFSDVCLIIRKEVPEDADFTFMEMDNRIGTNIGTSTISNMVRNLVELTTPSDTFNIDAENLDHSLRNKGTFVIGIGEGTGENRVSEALEDAFSSPLMKKCDIYTSRNILIKLLVSNRTELRTGEFSVISNFVEKMGASMDIKWGVAKSDDIQGEVELILLASGFDVKLPENS